MKPAAFDYVRPRSVDEAIELLARHGDEAKPLAGGQSLIPAMNFRLATPAVLVDLNLIEELAYIHSSAPVVRIGSMTRHRVVERDDTVRRLLPLVSETMPFVAHAAIRTRGTIGGSLAHADPAAELPAVLLALGGRVVVQGPAGRREIAARDFFTGLFSTALEPGELLTEIVIPSHAGPSRGWAFLEFSRRHGDFALAGVAAAVSLDDRGRCDAAAIALLSAGDRPLLAERAAASLTGEVPTPEAIAAAAHTAAHEEIDPTSDIHASSRYRRHLAEVLTRRTLIRAFTRARGNEG